MQNRRSLYDGGAIQAEYGKHGVAAGGQINRQGPLMVNTGVPGIMSRLKSCPKTRFLRKSAARNNPLIMISGPDR
jgi:hypothetical protein